MRGELPGCFRRRAAEILLQADKIRITVRTEKDGRRPQNTNVEIVVAPSIPGFQVDRGVGGEPLIIEVGVLPGDKLFYRDRAKDQYVNMDELTRRILDRPSSPAWTSHRASRAAHFIEIGLQPPIPL